MPKVFVLDTNVLLHDPRAIFKFDEHEVVLPIYVIEEVDRFKREMNELGRNARMLSRFIDELRETADANLQAGVVLPSGGQLRVAVPSDVLAERNGRSADHKILQVALLERNTHPESPTVFVTMDTNLRIRADALGLRAENYEGGRIEVDHLYTGFQTVTTRAEQVDQLAKRQPLPLTELPQQGQDLFPNACVILTDASNPKHTALGRVDMHSATLSPLRVPREGAWGVKPRNLEQSFALDLLLDDKVQLITLCGRAGTGKTLLAVAAGLRKVVFEGVHARLLVSRPVFPLGRDVGYLPGTIEEKLNPWMQPIFDNLEYIFATGGGRLDAGRSYEELIASGTIQVEPLTYIRGRTLPNQFLIVDEAQNLTPHEVKTIITRCGQDTKIVLTGDPEQIDNPYVDAQSNGLTTVAERFKAERIGGHVTLTKGERSELAERASQLL
ncbi:MAG TPA: PhoH family protein [Polyangiales bacterium]|nr:PhoH family protein [Polyangiales bacterium]